MTTNDEWVRARAQRLWDDEPTFSSRTKQVGRMAAALQEAIERTRAEERANAKQALRLAHEMQDKAVAADRDLAEAKLARLENPDEALVEAVKGAIYEYHEADHDDTPEGCAAHICRALARALTDGQDEPK